MSLIHYKCSVNSSSGFSTTLVVKVFSFFDQSGRKVTGFNLDQNLYDNMQFGVCKCTDCVCLLTFINFYAMVKIKNSIKRSKYRNCC